MATAREQLRKAFRNSANVTEEEFWDLVNTFEYEVQKESAAKILAAALSAYSRLEYETKGAEIDEAKAVLKGSVLIDLSDAAKKLLNISPDED